MAGGGRARRGLRAYLWVGVPAVLMLAALGGLVGLARWAYATQRSLLETSTLLFALPDDEDVEYEWLSTNRLLCLRSDIHTPEHYYVYDTRRRTSTRLPALERAVSTADSVDEMLLSPDRAKVLVRHHHSETIASLGGRRLWHSAHCHRMVDMAWMPDSAHLRWCICHDSAVPPEPASSLAIFSVRDGSIRPIQRVGRKPFPESEPDAVSTDGRTAVLSNYREAIPSVRLCEPHPRGAAGAARRPVCLRWPNPCVVCQAAFSSSGDRVAFWSYNEGIHVKNQLLYRLMDRLHLPHPESGIYAGLWVARSDGTDFHCVGRYQYDPSIGESPGGLRWVPGRHAVSFMVDNRVYLHEVE